ncbi:sulfotransferase [Spirulina sp. CS-785/01]|uniref:sulfotransferase family protein n=1 Tax=Spirulina sp. CS-785/01 TaxID=3021716 RepID=UPI00232B8D29|nr:sulfotransferase [Spirulina sp. CS-785/01]MDB9312789.1 sulfotransferase [Spirulina sp. CS-785/01]
MTLPNFLILGAPKSGTTALYEYLQQHPEIYMSPVKEPNFFAFEGKQPDYSGPKDEQAWTNRGSIVTLSEYQKLFNAVEDEKRIGEASTLYLYIPETPQRIHHYIPNAKLIAILRDPINRAFSCYLHFRRNGREWIKNFPKALAQEEKRRQNYWAPGWYYREVGLYSEQVQRYLSLFDRQQLQFYLYDDWQNNPHAFLKHLFNFLEIDDSFSPDMCQRPNQTSVVWKNNTVRDVLIKQNSLRQMLHNLVPDSIRKPVANFMLESIRDTPPKMTPELRSRLIPYFRDDILKLQDLIQRDLSHWLR